jgi:hypothetical protein
VAAFVFAAAAAAATANSMGQRLSRTPILGLCCLAADAPRNFAAASVIQRAEVHVPPLVHATMASPPPRNSIVVGDVHGCLDELKQLLRDCEYDTRVDQVILVGDLVNKGPASAGVVRYAREQNFLAVFGNHDEAALFNWRRRQALRDRGEAPDGGDKYAYVDDFDAADVAYISALPYTLSLPAYDAVVVHAGVVPGVPLESQHLADMYRMRNVARRQGSDGWHALEKGNDGVAWATAYEGERGHVYFGHDAKRKLQRERYATGLDTGCCYGGALTAVVLPERRLVQVQARKVYSPPKSP